MTLSTPELLRGSFAALSSPPPAESSGDFMAGTIGAVALILLLAAGESETAASVRYAENAAMRALFRQASEDDRDGAIGPIVANYVDGLEENLSLTALDAENDRLRAVLIALHVYAEESGHRPLEQQILRLLHASAESRMLKLPPMG